MWQYFKLKMKTLYTEKLKSNLRVDFVVVFS